MEWYGLVKTLHIVSSTVLFGTGLGIAFFMFRSLYAKDLKQKYYAVSNTVLADNLFTLPAVIVQPLSGLYLVHMAGYDGRSSWLIYSYILYGVAGLCWVPVVIIQKRLKALLHDALESGSALSPHYDQLFRYWFWLGWPAFGALLLIFYFMVTKP